MDTEPKYLCYPHAAQAWGGEALPGGGRGLGGGIPSQPPNTPTGLRASQGLKRRTCPGVHGRRATEPGNLPWDPDREPGSPAKAPPAKHMQWSQQVLDVYWEGGGSGDG